MITGKYVIWKLFRLNLKIEKFYLHFIDLQKQIASMDVVAMQKEIDDLDSIVSDQQVMSSKQQASIAGKALKQLF